MCFTGRRVSPSLCSTGVSSNLDFLQLDFFFLLTFNRLWVDSAPGEVAVRRPCFRKDSFSMTASCNVWLNDSLINRLLGGVKMSRVSLELFQGITVPPTSELD